MAREHPQTGQEKARSSSTIPTGQKRKRKDEQDQVDDLDRRVSEFEFSSQPPPALFSHLPLSQPTQSGLSKSHFKALTTIQARVIPSALKSNDILGAAKTGSGKTLAFVIPVLENLYRKRWTEYDGLGALILAPTRELAIQIFEVLRKVGRYHTFSAGLVIGGKSLQEERDRLGRMNILVATPGRILQHMDQTAEFEVQNLQMMVLDEADRVMDMGFQTTVDAIVEHLPKIRQTLLFSATQTKKVADLARLSMREAEFVSAHEGADSATPSTLQQNYVVTPLPEKVDTLWSFIRANVKKKILVFLSSGKQVRFLHEAFRHLQPGVPLLQLHGRQRQTARLDITSRFASTKYACLLATDVAARGLDFPAVDWVVQADCPEDADTYIHRVGRTARYEREGQAVLFLDPSEKEGMLKVLERKKVMVESINVRKNKMQSTIKNQLQNMCFKDPELKYLGQKCFVSYVRSVYVQKDKSIFSVKQLDLQGYATSLGLPGTPSIKFVKGNDAKTRKNAPRQLLDVSSGSGDDSQDGRSKVTEGPALVRTKYDRMFERKNQDVLTEHYQKMIDDGASKAVDGRGRHGISNKTDPSSDEDEDFLSVKRRFGAGDQALGRSSPSSLGSGSDLDGDSLLTNNTNSSHALEGQKRSSATAAPLPSSEPKKVIPLSSNPSDDPLLVDSKRREKLLKSKKKLLKYKGHGAHLHFGSDDNIPREAEYYEREAEFRKRGLPEEQREAFLRDETEKTREADLLDKEAARARRREKKDDRKRRARQRERTDNAVECGDGVSDTLSGPGAVLTTRAADKSPPLSHKSPPISSTDQPDQDLDYYQNDNRNHDDNHHHRLQTHTHTHQHSPPRNKRQRRPSIDSVAAEVQPRREMMETTDMAVEDLEVLAMGLLGKELS